MVEAPVPIVHQVHRINRGIFLWDVRILYLNVRNLLQRVSHRLHHRPEIRRGRILFTILRSPADASPTNKTIAVGLAARLAKTHNPSMVEALAILEALRHAKAMDSRNIWLRSDAQAIIIYFVNGFQQTNPLAVASNYF
ncbi:hypothetical protein C4D60_Mb09t02590 [Musa balbisiana]|uniref:RNase H type-1 domain-containing protein n=1 Tax=Musa balbisiana TaxID=52838 RepID=A0A4S8IEV0_MUSBA|nr:hypothetical protein C4D60_Mb09t02590 [Musa balbisiana]